MSSQQQPSSTTSLFRRLTWQSSITLEIRLARGQEQGHAPSRGQGGVPEVYYMQVPRNTYLPLLIPEIRENMVELALDDHAFGETNEKDWWFEEDIDLEEGEGKGGFASQGPCKWHWPLDLIQLHSVISRPLPSSSSSTSSASSTPLRLKLHLTNPPHEKLNLPNTVDQCHTQWVNQVKEADFVRWRNTSRTTGLRKGDFDAGWEGIVNDDFDSYSRFASRILPIPLPPPASTSSTPATRPGSTDPSGPTKDSAYTVRAIPIKIYLPDNAPVIHEMITPLGPDGKPQTVLSALQTYLPLLFPPSSATPYPLGIPLFQGVELPPQADLGWLSTCCCGADGWLRIGIRLRAG